MRTIFAKFKSCGTLSSNLFVRAAIVGMMALLTLVIPANAAEPATTGAWTLYPPQATVYMTSIHPPIKADGSSQFSANGHNVIPVQFQLLSGPGPVIFQSIFSDGLDPTFPGTNDFSYLLFNPGPEITFSQLNSLKADYSFIMGNCGGGALRWTVRVDVGNDNDPANDKNINIYYGDLPNFTDCSTSNQSGVNMIGQPDARYDTQQINAVFYNTYANTLALVGNLRVVWAALIIDSGWFAGDQKLNIDNVMVNDNTFVPLIGPFARICDLPFAKIRVTKIAGPGGPITPISIQPFDDNEYFRNIDCKYMYNLATSSLPGAGTYKVEAVINGNPVTGAAFFSLR